MMITVVALLMLDLADASGELLPTRLTFDDPPKFRAARRRQDQEPPRERPSGVEAARLRGEEEPGLWSVSAAPTLLLMGGKTRVREWDSSPPWLNLSNDLGLDMASGVRLGFAYETRHVRWFLEVDLSRSTGGGQFDRNFDYDEGKFVAHVPYRTHADFFFSRAGIAFPGAIWERRDGRITPFIGLEYVRMSLGIDQPGTGQSTSEQYKQFIPYPIVGVMAELNLSETVTLSGRIYGGMMPHIGTPFMEGGRMQMTVETVGAEVELSWQASPTVRLFASVGFQYWNGRLWSPEDDNEFRMSGPAIRFGVEIGW
jgi:hypothetical protein